MAAWKSLGWLAVGGIGGAAGTYFVVASGSGEAESASPLAAVADLAFGRSAVRAGGTIEIADQLDAYREAQAQTDPAELAEALERAAGARWSPALDVEIEALLGRLSEIAPEYAAGLAVSLGLDAVFVAEAYLAWAEADADAALAGLAQIATGDLRRLVALALTDVLGDSATGIERIAAALPLAERDALVLDWVAMRAHSDPFGAFRDLQRVVPPLLAGQSLADLAAVWAAQDPHAALAQSELLSPDLARFFRMSLFTEWARLDAEGFAAYLESAGSTLPPEAINGFPYVLLTSPERVERIAAGLPGAAGQVAQAAAMNALTLRDPEAAKARVAGMPPGLDRDRMASAVASALAEQDPVAALTWVRGLTPPSPNAARTVALALALADFDAAFEIIDNPEAFGIEPTMALTVISTLGSNDPSRAPALAERLLTRDDVESQAALRNLVRTWMQREPEGAVDWVLAHGSEVNGEVISSTAQALAARDPAAAAGYADRIPAAQRGSWVSGVASAYGSADPVAAMAWISNHQGQDYYEVAARDVIAGAARTDPRAAAQAFSLASANVQLGAAQSVGTAWAQQDPAAAARWATSLSNPGARESAVNAVATAWYGRDQTAAQRWILSQPAGAERDQILSSIASRAFTRGTFDADLLEGFTSATARAQAATIAIITTSRTDAAGAHALLEREITDPAERERLAGVIEQNSRTR